MADPTSSQTDRTSATFCIGDSRKGPVWTWMKYDIYELWTSINYEIMIQHSDTCLWSQFLAFWNYKPEILIVKQAAMWVGIKSDPKPSISAMWMAILAKKDRGCPESIFLWYSNLPIHPISSFVSFSKNILDHIHTGSILLDLIISNIFWAVWTSPVFFNITGKICSSACPKVDHHFQETGSPSPWSQVPGMGTMRARIPTRVAYW